MSQLVERGRLLYEQKRYAQAELEFRAALGENPNNTTARGMLALSLRFQKKLAEALDEARACVAAAPDSSFAFNVLADIEFHRVRYDEAERAVRESLRLNPVQPSALATLSACHYNRQCWVAALLAAEKGLSFDPNDSDCLRLRSISLAKLGRRDEAREVSRHALAEHPENSLLWSIRGWQLLRAKDFRGALEAFRESLRLEPQYEGAREGIVTSLKAQYRVYRWLFSYYVWLASRDAGIQVAIIIGQLISVPVIASLAHQVRVLRPYSDWLFVIGLLLVFLSWIADPLFQLCMRLSRFGRLVLSRDEIIESNWVAGCLLVSAAALVIWPFAGSDASLEIAYFASTLIVPICLTFMATGARRVKFAIMTAAIALAEIGCVYALIDGVLPEQLQLSRAIEEKLVVLTGFANIGLIFLVPIVLSRSTRRV